jgi:hypothetical protein
MERPLSGDVQEAIDGANRIAGRVVDDRGADVLGELGLHAPAQGVVDVGGNEAPAIGLLDGIAAGVVSGGRDAAHARVVGGVGPAPLPIQRIVGEGNDVAARIGHAQQIAHMAYLHSQ